MENTRHQAWNYRHELHQKILNSLPVPPERAQRKLPQETPIRARIHWEKDGPEIIETIARYWATLDGQTISLAVISDKRWRLQGIWLPIQDTRKISPQD